MASCMHSRGERVLWKGVQWKRELRIEVGRANSIYIMKSLIAQLRYFASYLEGQKGPEEVISKAGI